MKASRNNQTCRKCRPVHWCGKMHTDETKKRMSASSRHTKSNLGKKFSQEHCNKIAAANLGNPGRTGIPHSEETKQHLRDTWIGKTHPNSYPENREKFRELHQRRVISRHGQIFPNYNTDACNTFEEINKEFGWDGRHAENGGEIQVRGWFLDYYEPTQNIAIEFDEPYHDMRTKRKEKDIVKEKEILEELNCKFYRLHPGEDWRVVLNLNNTEN